MKLNRVVLFILACSSLPLWGCASPANPQAMIPDAADIQQRHAGAVSVNVRGGSDTNPLWVSQVSNVDFKKAVEDAVVKYRVFDSVKPQGEAPYHIEIVLQKLAQPFAGFSMNVTAVTNWELHRKGEAAPIWKDAVVSQHTATVGDHFVGVERLRLANEGAIKANIKEGIEKISRQKL